MIKINLVPQEILEKETQRQQVVQAGAVVGAVLVVVILASFAHYYKANRLETQLKLRQAEFNRLKKIVDQVEELERTAAAVRTRLGVITSLLKGRPLYPYFMLDLSATLPPDVWLSAISTKEGNHLEVSMQASAASSEGISAWMRSLQQSGKFSEPVLSAVTSSGVAPDRVNAFSITTSYKSPKL